MLNGLDLFSGIGGISLALSDWIRPIAYCEIDKYCQAVLLSRIATNELKAAPIWDDIRSFNGSGIKGNVDIIYGGFPCQDISVAGHGKGLAGERSGLFWEIHRLAKEILPTFIFLENVPAITSRGGLTVVRAIAEMGYDCRWCVISAASIGALHRRERWFLLGYSKHHGRNGTQERRSDARSIHSCKKRKNEASESKGTSTCEMLASESISCHTDSNHKNTLSAIQREQITESSRICGDVANTESIGWEKMRQPIGEAQRYTLPTYCGEYGSIDEWQEAVSSVCRTTDGISQRVDRLRGLGNAVVPEQAKEAFKILMGIT